MKKKLYDFSIFNAIVVVLAYAFLITLSVYFIYNSNKNYWIGIIITILLVISFGLILWYYVFLAVTVTDKGVKHGHKFIDKKDLKWKIEYNRRFRYKEIIFYNKYVNYKKITKKERKKKEIVVQYFPKYEPFIQEYFSGGQKKGQNDEEK